MEYSISTQHLSFAFRNQPILKDLALNIPKGSVYGYLGKNGSGKSTTIKLLLGLLKNQQGSIQINNYNLDTHRKEVLGCVGCLIEAPAFYQKFTAYENLKYNSYYYPNCDESRINELLELVDLTDARNKKVNKFSTGMYQRLGIARALLNDPEILILDEPLNGLDPNGIHLIRELIAKLNQQGKTIFLSSHILDEIEKTCTHVGILDHGELKYQGELKNLMLQKQQIALSTRAEDISKVQQICLQHGFTFRKISDVDVQVGVNDQEAHNQFIYLLVENSVVIYGITSTRNHLEDLFLSMTQQQTPKL